MVAPIMPRAGDAGPDSYPVGKFNCSAHERRLPSLCSAIANILVASKVVVPSAITDSTTESRHESDKLPASVALEGVSGEIDQVRSVFTLDLSQKTVPLSGIVRILSAIDKEVPEKVELVEIKLPKVGPSVCAYDPDKIAGHVFRTSYKLTFAESDSAQTSTYKEDDSLCRKEDEYYKTKWDDGPTLYLKGVKFERSLDISLPLFLPFSIALTSSKFDGPVIFSSRTRQTREGCDTGVVEPVAAQPASQSRVPKGELYLSKSKFEAEVTLHNVDIEKLDIRFSNIGPLTINCSSISQSMLVADNDISAFRFLDSAIPKGIILDANDIGDSVRFMRAFGLSNGQLMQLRHNRIEGNLDLNFVEVWSDAQGVCSHDRSKIIIVGQKIEGSAFLTFALPNGGNVIGCKDGAAASVATGESVNTGKMRPVVVDLSDTNIASRLEISLADMLEKSNSPDGQKRFSPVLAEKVPLSVGRAGEMLRVDFSGVSVGTLVWSLPYYEPNPTNTDCGPNPINTEPVQPFTWRGTDFRFGHFEHIPLDLKTPLLLASDDGPKQEPSCPVHASGFQPAIPVLSPAPPPSTATPGHGAMPRPAIDRPLTQSRGERSRMRQMDNQEQEMLELEKLNEFVKAYAGHSPEPLERVEAYLRAKGFVFATQKVRAEKIRKNIEFEQKLAHSNYLSEWRSNLSEWRSNDLATVSGVIIPAAHAANSAEPRVAEIGGLSGTFDHIFESIFGNVDFESIFANAIVIMKYYLQQVALAVPSYWGWPWLYGEQPALALLIWASFLVGGYLLYKRHARGWPDWRPQEPAHPGRHTPRLSDVPGFLQKDETCWRPFSPLWYSVECMVPLLNLEQKSAYRPHHTSWRNHWIVAVPIIQTIAGWWLGTLLISMLIM
jgi:hypothetical protein